jgi:hypothetical protein
VRWVWERTGLNILEQRQLPASVMRGYRQRFRAGHKAAAADEEGGLGGVMERGW